MEKRRSDDERRRGETTEGPRKWEDRGNGPQGGRDLGCKELWESVSQKLKV